MLAQDKLHSNAAIGLTEAPRNVVDVYVNKGLRYMIEALLLDGERAPVSLYADLFGFTVDDVIAYKKWFFVYNEDAPISRLDFYTNLTNTVKTSTEYSLKDQVFHNGWEAIDIEFNRGRNIDVSAVTKEAYSRSVVFLNSRVKELLGSTAFTKELNDDFETGIKKLKDILSIVKDANKLFPNIEAGESSAGEQLLIQFKDKVDDVRPTAGDMHSEVVGIKADELGDVTTSDLGEDYDDIRSDVAVIVDKVKEKGNSIQYSLEDLDTKD